ncbi:MAG: hypothetical protein FJX84_10290, partial [Bacteroidetes bacterium]|nr:hypothetical protein [Bacteroidota bacterium]
MRFLIFLLALLLTQKFYSQNGFLEGVVTDDKGNPIEGAEVIYRKDFTRGARSDEKGFYQMELPAGSVKIVCKYTDMKNDTSTITILSGQTVIYNFQLKSLIKELDQFEIKVGKFDKSIEEQTVSMVVIKPQLIENKNTRSIETALDQTPGLNILDGEPQIRGGSGFTFGVGSKVAVIVDDMPMLSGDAGRPEWGFIPIENISQVEIIKGAASVLSGSSALSGSIHIRTAYPQQKPVFKLNVYSGAYSAPSSSPDAKWNESYPYIHGVNFLYSKKYNTIDFVLGGNLNYDHGYIGPPKTDSIVATVFPDTISNFTEKQLISKRGRLNFNLRKRSEKYKGLSYGV